MIGKYSQVHQHDKTDFLQVEEKASHGGKERRYKKPELRYGLDLVDVKRCNGNSQTVKGLAQTRRCSSQSFFWWATEQ
jgi:hypothetical protein